MLAWLWSPFTGGKRAPEGDRRLALLVKEESIVSNRHWRQGRAQSIVVNKLPKKMNASLQLLSCSWGPTLCCLLSSPGQSPPHPHSFPGSSRELGSHCETVYFKKRQPPLVTPQLQTLPPKTLEKAEPAMRILRLKSHLVLSPNVQRGCLGGPRTTTGGWSEQRISMRFMKDSKEANSICRGTGTALGPSRAPNRPRSSSRIISLLQIPRVEVPRTHLRLHMI